MISEESLSKFKMIYKQVYGIELTDKDTNLLADNLLNLYRTAYFGNLNMNINNQNEKEI